MDKILEVFSVGGGGITLILTIALVVIFLALLNHYLRSHWDKNKFQFQFFMLCLSLVGGVVIIISLPLSDALRGQLLTLFGILLSGAIAFASTTFIGNILAGLMLRAIKNIKLGDYITVNDITGRATEMNLLHVEVQTEQSDLVTIPNMLMVTYPVKVVRSTGTIVSVDVSLGYDIHRQQISELLCLASEDAGLVDGFVQVRSLGDFSVTYRIAGKLNDISNLLSVKAHLYNAVLDRLHSERIEIVSPNFMNTRSVDGRLVVPNSYHSLSKAVDNSLEKLAFEKAEAASKIANIQLSIDQLTLKLEADESTLSEVERGQMELKVEELNALLKRAEVGLNQHSSNQTPNPNRQK